LQVGNRGNLIRGPVNGELDPAVSALLLHPVRDQLEQLGEHAVRVVGTAAHGQPDHESRAGGRLASPSDSPSRRASSRCSSLRLDGTATLKITYWSPRAVPRRPGNPRPRSIA